MGGTEMDRFLLGKLMVLAVLVRKLMVFAGLRQHCGNRKVAPITLAGYLKVPNMKG
jgi:hypothetical protein